MGWCYAVVFGGLRDGSSHVAPVSVTATAKAAAATTTAATAAANTQSAAATVKLLSRKHLIWLKKSKKALKKQSAVGITQRLP